MPQDSIRMMVENIEPLYNDKIGLFSKWVEEGDSWSEQKARKEALALAGHFAEAIESMPYTQGKYSRNEIEEYADKLMDQFGDYREEHIRWVAEQASGKPSPEDLAMDPGDVEHARKYEEMARQIGIDRVRELIPVSPEKIRQVLSRGDKHLNTIPLRKWDRAALNLSLRERGLSMSEGVCVLKHVAKWHYA